MADDQSAAALPSLPHDLLVDIISRLPVKSLVRFRCVSKSWNSYIRHPKFIALHLKKTVADINQSCRRRAVMSAEPFRVLICEEIYQENEIDRVVEIEFPHEFVTAIHSRDFFVVGTCNGLVCVILEGIDGHKTYFLWNPATREYREFNESGVDGDEESSCFMFAAEYGIYYCICGFGYDSKVDDYKIVVVKKGHGVNRPEVEVEILPVGSNRLSRAGGLITGFVPSYSGVCINGRLHWLEREKVVMSEENETQIICFSLEKETFEEAMSVPDHVDRNDDFVIDMKELNGKLSLVVGQKDTKIGDVEIWEIEQYGGKETWTKKFIMSTKSCPVAPIFKDWMTPLCFLRNDELLVLVNDDEFVIYEPKANMYRNVNLNLRKPWCWISETSHFETLVSPYHTPRAAIDQS